LYAFFISPQVGTVQSAWLLFYGLDNEEIGIQLLAEQTFLPSPLCIRAVLGFFLQG